MRVLRSTLLLAALAQPLAAQQGPTLSLDEALQLARRNNPTYLQSLNARDRAGAQLRTAWGSLAPSLIGDFGFGFREGRPQFFAGQRFGASSNTISSSAGLSLQGSYSTATLLGPREQRHRTAAAELDAGQALTTLRANVTQQYFLALQQQATAVLQDTLLANARAQLELARARLAAGAATELDVRRAEVAVGQQQVASIRARNQVEIEKLRLFQQLGVAQPADVRLVTDFPVTAPEFQLQTLLGEALRANPAIAANRERQAAADVGVRRARGEYLPSFGFSAGVNGVAQQFTNDEYVVSQSLSTSRQLCLAGGGNPATCAGLTYSQTQRDSVLGTNRNVPFNLTRNPLSASFGFTLPIFNGFQREQRLQEASAARADARHDLRARELQITADVTAAFRTLSADWEAIRIQQQNAQAARQALELAQQRYRVGAQSYVDVAQARADFERAETDRITAVYTYHRDFAALENAVGRPLR